MDIEMISPREIQKYMRMDGTILVDMRDTVDFLDGHIRGAINIPYESLPFQYNYLKDFERVLLYCDRGNASLIAAKDMAKEGIGVYAVCGGIHAYEGTLVKD